MVDSVSGSLKGSEPVSPVSPGSPGPPADPRNNTSSSNIDLTTSPAEISRALASLQAHGADRRRQLKATPPLGPRKSFSPSSGGAAGEQRGDSSSVMAPLPVDILDPDALISIDVMIISPNCPTLNAAAASR